MRLILASASPRRAQILRDAGFHFETLPTEIDESRQQGETAAAMVQRLAEAKARAAEARVRETQKIGEPAIILAADTAVELDGEVLGKPYSTDDARSMLMRLSGKTHFVHTGIALLCLADKPEDRGMRIAVETTAVRFAPIASEEIERYVATGEALDKAGAYGIQGIAGRFVEKIEGSYFNVVGLPLSRVYGLLRELGWRES